MGRLASAVEVGEGDDVPRQTDVDGDQNQNCPKPVSWGCFGRYEDVKDATFLVFEFRGVF